MSTSENDRNGIQVISRAAAILRSLENEPTGLSLGAIAKRIELPRSTVQRLVDALAMEQLLEVRGAGGVCLGPALMRLASRSHTDITKHARPYLEELSRQTGETAVLVHTSGADLMILHSVVSGQELRVAPVTGNFLTIYATSGGKVLLAKMDDKTVMQLLDGKVKPLTPKTLALEQLLEELKQIRLDGYAYDFEEHMTGVGAVAIGLQTPQGHYAISLVGPVSRIEAAQATIKQALADCQEGLTAALRSID